LVDLKEISLSDEFIDPQGRWLNYATHNAVTDNLLRDQQHVDIRAFISGWESSPALIFYYEGKALSGFDGQTMAQLNSGPQTKTDDQWTMGSAGRQASVGGYRGLSLACTTGANKSSSVQYTTLAYTEPTRSVDELYDTVDIATGFEDTDHISIALPNFPLASIDLAQSYLDLSSTAPTLTSAPPYPPTNAYNDSHFFTTFAALKFSDATLTTDSGNTELRWPRSAVTGIDLSAITAIRFRITATANCTFMCTGLRLLKPNWTYLALDINTQTQALERPPARTGKPASEYDSASSAPFDILPEPLFRSDAPSSVNDPRPIDVHLAIAFNTGSIQVPSWEANFLRVYLRERSEDLMTPLDLDGIDTDADGELDYGFTMKDLNLGLEHATPRPSQPDYGRAMYQALTQDELNQADQGELDGDLMADLERMPDNAAGAWITAELRWETDFTTIVIRDTETPDGDEYRFDRLPGLAKNKEYLLDVDLRDDAIRVRVYLVGPQGQLDDPLIDTGLIRDPFMFHRTAGRVGWLAFANDNDVVIHNIRTRSTSFGQYESQPFASLTPVVGAEIFASTSPPVPAPVGIEARGATLAFDSAKDESYRITSRHTQEGIQTTFFEIEDFRNTFAQFNVWYPRSGVAAGGRLKAFLISERGHLINLSLGAVSPDTWQRVEIDLRQAGNVQAGLYALNIVQEGEIAATWWVQNLRILKRSIAWAGLSEPGDAWQIKPGIWTDFENFTNQSGNGALFKERGRSVKVRGEALSQSAFIERVSVKPKYAELGRLIWKDPEPPVPLPTASFTIGGSSAADHTFTSTSTAAPGHRIVRFAWTFGDGGRAFGPYVEHTFPTGMHTVTLTVTDELGRSAVAQQQVTLDFGSDNFVINPDSV
jgi:hypothetical protein